MPWKDGTKFVARRLEGEAMSDLCREFGFSRTTGHKIFNRYSEVGAISMCDRSRWRPALHAPKENQHLRRARRSARRPQASRFRQVDDGIWLISFMQYDLEYVDLEARTLQTVDNPFGVKV